ncbi:hypothetical protein [Alteromonas sp. 14N.309.X.WAT.G.H12]|uniref:hypothetical protein n=1 Tax=Alteromonas sp. 14N.309.X.WAT.G.H12 TaxID=3120824 RepID=UPI002FD4CB02
MLTELPAVPVLMEFTDYLKKHRVSIEHFAIMTKLYLPALQRTMHFNRLYVFDSRLYYKATQYSPSFKLGKKAVPVTLHEHIQTNYGGDLVDFANKHGDNPIFVETSVSLAALWVAREVLLPCRVPSAYPIVSIQSHIESAFSDNATEFGRRYKKPQQQVHRWKSKNAAWCLGNVYLRRTEFNPELHIGKTPRQAVLFHDYLYGGLFLSEDEWFDVIKNNTGKTRSRLLKRMFKEKYIRYSNQIDRYINYPGTMWVDGDIYKKQTDFTPFSSISTDA